MRLTRTFLLCLALLVVFSFKGWSQSSPAEAFTNVTIHTADGNTIKSGSIVWRKGVVTSIGKNIDIPFDAYVRDGGDSLHVYPGFIDGLALWGSPKVEKNEGAPPVPGNPSYKRAGIQPHLNPSKVLNPKDKALNTATKKGFTTAGLGLKGQMLPGQIDLFFINGEDTEKNLLEPGIAVMAQFKEAQGAAYPSTTMAVMSRYRQLFNDAKALQEQQQYFASTSTNYPAPEKNKVLEALYPVMDNQKPFYFVADSKENIERLFWLQDDLGFDLVLVSGKEAYTKADELKKRNIPVLVSIDLPEKPEWMEEETADKVTDEMETFRKLQRKEYEAAVNNISQLIEADVKVGYASNGMALSEINGNIKRLLEEGDLTDTEILTMLTQSTADILGFGNKMGDLSEGQIANFSVFTKPFTEDEAKVVYSVASGEVKELKVESSK